MLAAAVIEAAAAAAAAEAARLAAEILQFDRGAMASMGVVMAVEAFDTWHTSSHTGFLLILLLRPLVLLLLDSLVLFLLAFLVRCLREIYFDPSAGFLSLARWQRCLVVLCMLAILFLLLILSVTYLIWFRFLVFGISVLVVFILFLPGVGFATQAFVY
jgi:hypothetical protein